MGSSASKEKSGATLVPEARVASVTAYTSRATVEERIEHPMSHWSKSGAAFVPEASHVRSVSACTSTMSVEEKIERSRSHWSESMHPTQVLSVEEAAEIKLDNEALFKKWESHPEYGFFFYRLHRFRDLKVGKKFAEGTQAELFNVRVQWLDFDENAMNAKYRRKWVVKVFKEGTKIRDLENQWPHGMFQMRALASIFYKRGLQGSRCKCHIQCATLLEDGRFAFLMLKEDNDLCSFIEHKMLKGGHGDGGPFRRVQGEEYMCDIALGVEQLHRHNVIHRDLKASNVLAHTNRFGVTHCLVADFECSIGVVGTGYWRAPEILQACKERKWQEKPEVFSKAADIYSLGMTFYEILTGKRPFQDEEVTIESVIHGQRPHVPGFVDEWAHQLLLWCWHPDSRERPPIEVILRILQANFKEETSSSEYIKTRLEERLELIREEEVLANN